MMGSSTLHQLDKELVSDRNIHLPLTTAVLLTGVAVSNKRDLYNIMTANDHNVIGPVELKTSVILIKYHLTRSHTTDKFIVGCGIIACLDILFQTISNSSTDELLAMFPLMNQLLPFVRLSYTLNLNGWRVRTICLDILVIIKEMSCLMDVRENFLTPRASNEYKSFLEQNVNHIVHTTDKKWPSNTNASLNQRYLYYAHVIAHGLISEIIRTRASTFKCVNQANSSGQWELAPQQNYKNECSSLGAVLFNYLTFRFKYLRWVIRPF